MDSTCISPDYRFWRNGIHGIAKCQDTILNRIFAEEVERAGLTGLDIELLTPEEPERFPYKEQDLVASGGNQKEGYWIEVTISPNGLRDHFSDNCGTWFETIRDGGLEKYADLEWYDIFRRVVGRQLTLIRWGLKDDEARMGSIVEHLYTYCVTYPKNFYKNFCINN